MNVINCAPECNADGSSCRLKNFALIRGLNLNILERRSLNALNAFAFAQEERLRLCEKREFMLRLGVNYTHEIDCKQRVLVDTMDAECHQRERKFSDALLAEEKAKT